MADTLTNDETLHEIDTLADDHHATGSGHVHLFHFLLSSGNEAARHVAWQFLIFYGLLLVGFCALWFMMRSTARIQELKREVGEALRAQQAQRFDLDNYSALAYGGVA